MMVLQIIISCLCFIATENQQQRSSIESGAELFCIVTNFANYKLNLKNQESTEFEGPNSKDYPQIN